MVNTYSILKAFFMVYICLQLSLLYLSFTVFFGAHLFYHLQYFLGIRVSGEEEVQRLTQQLHVTVAQRTPLEFLRPLKPYLEVEPGETARYRNLNSCRSFGTPSRLILVFTNTNCVKYKLYNF